MRPRAFNARPRPVTATMTDLVSIRPLEGANEIPQVVTPVVPQGIDLAEFTRANRDAIGDLVTRHGALLFRDFDVPSIAAFRAVATAYAPQLASYQYQSTPRSVLDEGIYTSTEYPPEETIPLHNENSYARVWPLKLWFHAAVTPREGGETPIADSRRVYERIPADIRERVARRGLMYVRNYGPGLDLPWQRVFQTEDRATVEAYLRAQHMSFEWIGVERLRTRQVCHAVAEHPKTGDRVWFNQAHLFHVSNLAPNVREAMCALHRDDELPRNTLYGDGQSLEPEVLEVVRAAYAACEVRFAWKQGDVLMLDNMLVAHGRRPFVGPRLIAVAMAEAHSAPAT